MDQTSHAYSLYIPRVSISTSNSSSARHSGKPRQSEDVARRKKSDIDRSQMYLVRKVPRASNSAPSSSSSSSVDSNFSNYNVNSLLLSVKNLENFNKSAKAESGRPPVFFSETNPNVIMKPSIYNNNYVINYENKLSFPIFESRSKMLENIRSIAVDNGKSVEEKEVDEVSMTSSNTATNFTVVSLNDSHQRLTKSKAICRRSHQITILILIMTIIFIVIIGFMLILMDMRNQKMPS